ncbi:uncharacterized protein LOC111592361 isoform X2 [Drosophila hydei]|uniref:Uncharacterized protein LOC111592361 isoform X2 n=1 Tax=Drosophila hydei TaxID=7224 RepID=A0A6J1L3M9_DROHY|nr:uncharacterized protein LOC111592361 isoform X2 [Drosophila hydei]
MQSQNVRPISTYDNLTATTTSAAKPKMKPQQQQQDQQQQQQPVWTGKTPGQMRQELRDSPSIAMNGNKKSWQANSQDRHQLAMPEQVSELNETSHSIAAVKAALSDAKSKFFGIHSCETLDVAASPPSERDSPAAAMPSVVIKPEPKYQNVPQPTRIPVLPEASSSPTIVSHRFGATYEQIPLSDLDASQPTQAVYMSTTVPQNMKGMKIAGRHTPTRNSLRHSRMIVVNNKNHDSIQETYTSHIRNSNFSRQLLILQLAIGLLIVGLAISILIWTPSASILINPYLSGLSLYFSFYLPVLRV